MLELILPILKRVLESVFPSPEQRLELEKALSEAVQKEAESRAREREQITNEFIEIIRATQPSPDRVYVWANTLIALVRPAISVTIVLAMVFRTDTIKSLVETFANAGPTGWIVMAPVLWWFFGRDIAKFLGREGLLVAMSNGNGGENFKSSKLQEINEKRQKETIEALRRQGRLE